MVVLRVSKPRHIDSEEIVTKKDLINRRKKLLEEIVCLDCISKDYIIKIKKLYAKKRKIDFVLKSY